METKAIVNRLRMSPLPPQHVCLAAANEIERLQSENMAMKKALELWEMREIYLRESKLILGE